MSSRKVCQISENEPIHITFFFFLRKLQGCTQTACSLFTTRDTQEEACFDVVSPLTSTARCAEMVDMAVNIRIPAGCYKNYCGKCENTLKLPLIVLSTSEGVTRCFPIREGCCTLQAQKGPDSGRRQNSFPAFGSAPKGKRGNGNQQGNRGKNLSDP